MPDRFAAGAWKISAVEARRVREWQNLSRIAYDYASGKAATTRVGATLALEAHAA